MKAECVAASVLLTIVFVAPAHAACKQGEVLRTNTRGQPQCVKQGRTFNECVANGMALGHPRIGPSGESDRRGAVGYCHSLGL